MSPLIALLVFVLDARAHYIGLAGQLEWLEPPSPPPEAESFELKFSAAPNAGACSLFIRQRDVKLTWPVLLNGRKLGALELNETPLVACFEVPAGLLRAGENSLHILSPEKPDDICIEEVRLDPRPSGEALAGSTVTVSVGVPCRLTLVDDRHALAPLRMAAGQIAAARTGVIYTGDGRATFTVPPGAYTLYATRGPEYSLATQPLQLAEGEHRTVRLEITREVPTPGLVALDTHIHTFTHSRHGDATLEERMLALAGEGIELAVASDHNTFVDYREPARKMGVDSCFTSVIGDEVTTTTGHFIAFPTASTTVPLPDHRLPTWSELFTSMRAIPGNRVIILNHPRDLHDGFIPFAPANFNAATGENLRGPDFTFDGVEVVNSGTLQSDYRQSFRDWFALLNRGYRTVAIGCSDSHDVSRFIVGQGRTYVACDDRDPARIDIGKACQSLLAGHATVSLGLMTSLLVEDKFGPGDLATIPGPEIHVHLQVLGPSWIQADHVALYANGVVIREQALAPSAAVRKASLDWTIPKPARDLYLVAIATGPPVEEPYWRIPSPYQPTNGIRHPCVIGATNPVWIDADGDGKFTAPGAPK